MKLGISMRSFNKITIWIFVLTVAGFAGGNLTSSFEFLRTDYSPRTAAMADAFVTIHGDVNGLFTNPATAAYIQQRQFAFNYTNYILDINGGSAAYTHVLPRYGRLSVGVQYMNYGKFDRTNEFAELTGQSFTANDLALAVALSDTLGRNFSYGVTAKYIFSKIQDYTAGAVALDFGLLYEAPFEKDLFFAVVMTNLGTNFDYYADRQESLPLRIRVGVSKKLAHLPLELGVALNDLNMQAENFAERAKRFSVGGEFRLSDALRLRLGYNNDLHSGFSETADGKFAGVSGGFGIYWKNFRFDYAYSNFSSLGAIHRIGIFSALN